MIKLTPVVKTLLFINIGVMVIDAFVPALQLPLKMGQHHFEATTFAPYQIFTSFFAHSGLMHLLFNMMGLVMLGSVLEMVWGSKRFLTFYLICGVGSGLIYGGINYWEMSVMQSDLMTYMSNADPYVFAQIMQDNLASGSYTRVLEFIEQFKENPTNPQFIEASKQYVQTLIAQKIEYSYSLGASGAISGILAGFAILFPDQMLSLIFPPISMKAKHFVIVFVVGSLVLTWLDLSGDNIAHFAHIGGVLVGFICVKLWNKSKFLN